MANFMAIALFKEFLREVDQVHLVSASHIYIYTTTGSIIVGGTRQKLGKIIATCWLLPHLPLISQRKSA